MNNLPKQLAAHLTGSQPVDFPALTADESLALLISAESEGVLPLLLLSLNGEQRTLLDTLFSRQFGLSIAQYTRSLVAREMLWLNEINTVGSALSERGLRGLVFKGLALAYSLYPQSFLRVRCDVDVLFSSRVQADQAWAVLQHFGYSRNCAIDGKVITSEFCAVKQGAGGPLVFDVHWNTNNAIHCRSLSFDELYADACVLDAFGTGFRVPTPVHGFVLACHHRIAHRPEKLHNRLIWLYDLHLLLNSFCQSEWQALMEIIQRHDIAPTCLDGIEASMAFFDTPVDAEWLVLIRQSAQASRNSLPVGDSQFMADMAVIGRQPGIRNKLLAVTDYLFPSSQYMMAKYEFKSRLLLPFFYTKRALLGVLKRL